MPVCYCKNSGGYGRFLQVIEQKPVKPKVEEEQETEPAKRKLHQLEPLKPSKRETSVRRVETGMEFETVSRQALRLPRSDWARMRRLQLPR